MRRATTAAISAIADFLRTAATDIPLARFSYVQAMMLRARALRASGREYDAAEAALRAWRATPKGLGVSREAWCRQLMEKGCYTKGRLVSTAQNHFLAQFVGSPEAAMIRQEFAGFPPPDRVRLRYPRPNDDPERQGDLIILKTPVPATGERGVLFIKYSEAFKRLAAVFDLGKLAVAYQVVLEPSWWGYQDATFWLFLGNDLDAVILAQRRADFDFISELRTNLVPVRLGAGDWVDGDTFRPVPHRERDFDVVMVAGWSP